MFTLWRVIPEAPWPTPKAWTPLSLPRSQGGEGLRNLKSRRGPLLETSFREEVGGGDGIVSKLGYVLLSCLDLEINLSQPRWSQIFNNPEIEICSLKIAFIVEIYAYSRQLPSWCVCGHRLPPIQPFEFPKKKIESPNKSKTKIKAAATLVSSLKLPSPLGTKSNPIHPIGLFTYCNGLQLAFLHPQKTQKRS